MRAIEHSSEAPSALPLVHHFLLSVLLSPTSVGDAFFFVRSLERWLTPFTMFSHVQLTPQLPVCLMELPGSYYVIIGK